MITIEGDRHSGRTETLISITTADALRGRRVLYVTYPQGVATSTFHRIINEIPMSCVQKIRRSVGNQRIDLTNGGLIDVRTTSSSGQRGISVDTLILDDAGWHDADLIVDAIPCVAAAPDPRVYIARCTGVEA